MMLRCIEVSKVFSETRSEETQPDTWLNALPKLIGFMFKSLALADMTLMWSKLIFNATLLTTIAVTLLGCERGSPCADVVDVAAGEEGNQPCSDFAPPLTRKHSLRASSSPTLPACFKIAEVE